MSPASSKLRQTTTLALRKKPYALLPCQKVNYCYHITVDAAYVAYALTSWNQDWGPPSNDRFLRITFGGKLIKSRNALRGNDLNAILITPRRFYQYLFPT